MQFLAQVQVRSKCGVSSAVGTGTRHSDADRFVSIIKSQDSAFITITVFIPQWESKS
jgi:hypothetical protein